MDVNPWVQQQKADICACWGIYTLGLHPSHSLPFPLQLRRTGSVPAHTMSSIFSLNILFKSLSILAYVIISNNKGLSESTPYNISRFGSESRQTQFWCHSHSSGERVTFSSPQGTSGCALSCPKQLDTCKYCLKDQQLFSSFGSFTMQQEKSDLLGPLWSTFITGLLFFFCCEDQEWRYLSSFWSLLGQLF